MSVVTSPVALFVTSLLTPAAGIVTVTLSLRAARHHRPADPARNDTKEDHT